MDSFIIPNVFVAVRLPSEQVKILQVVPNSDISLGKYGSFPANQILGRPYYVTFEIIESTAQLHVVEINGDALIDEEEDVSISVHTQDDEPPQTNQLILDETTNQRLSMKEIEELKANSNGDNIITRILESHSAIDQKTAFSLAKYTLRKERKFLKRFMILPLDVVTLADWLMNDREFSKYLELRNEALGMALCFANVYDAHTVPDLGPSRRHLVVDDTGGLVVAAMAERMGILGISPGEEVRKSYASITLIHSNSQPNLALLRYFGFDINFPPPQHLLSAHLKTLSWRQLVSPESDQSCIRPATVSPEVLATWKSTRRGNHYRKHQRCSNILSLVDETQKGGFQALVVASHTSATSILRSAVPLLAGGAQVVVFSPNIEPLADLADAYSTARRTAFINASEEERTDAENFTVDPTLLLGVTILTTSVQHWQILTSRSHPSMTSPGGAEGYLFVATRVFPSTGKTQARGTTGGKKRRAVAETLETIR